MKVMQKSEMKKSLLLSRDVSLKDIINPNQKTTIEKSVIFMRKHTPPVNEEYDEHRKLFTGLKYKKIDSLDTNDG